MLPTRISYNCSTPELSEINFSDGLEIKLPSPLGWILQAVSQKQLRNALLFVFTHGSIQVCISLSSTSTRSTELKPRESQP